MVLTVDFYESITTLRENGDGTYTYTNEAGEEVIIEAGQETVTTLIQNTDGSYTYINEEGVFNCYRCTRDSNKPY